MFTRPCWRSKSGLNRPYLVETTFPMPNMLWRGIILSSVFAALSSDDDGSIALLGLDMFQNPFFLTWKSVVSFAFSTTTTTSPSPGFNCGAGWKRSLQRNWKERYFVHQLQRLLHMCDKGTRDPSLQCRRKFAPWKILLWDSSWMDNSF